MKQRHWLNVAVDFFRLWAEMRRMDMEQDQEQERHVTEHVDTKGTWHVFVCPICARHEYIQFYNERGTFEYRRRVIYAGDTSAMHRGSVTGIDGADLDLAAPEAVDPADLPDDSPVPEAFRSAFEKER